MKWDTLSGTNYVLNSLQFSRIAMFLIQHVDLRYCYLSVMENKYLHLVTIHCLLSVVNCITYTVFATWSHLMEPFSHCTNKRHLLVRHFQHVHSCMHYTLQEGVMCRVDYGSGGRICQAVVGQSAVLS